MFLSVIKGLIIFEYLIHVFLLTAPISDKVVNIFPSNNPLKLIIALISCKTAANSYVRIETINSIIIDFPVPCPEYKYNAV